MELDDDLLCLDLSREAAQASFVCVGRRADHELLAKLVRELRSQVNRRLFVDAISCVDEAQRIAQLILSEPLHANQQSAALPRATCPPLDAFIDLLPATKVEVADAEISAVSEVQGLAQCRQE